MSVMTRRMFPFIFTGTRTTGTNDNRMDAAARLINTLILVMMMGDRRARLNQITRARTTITRISGEAT